MDKPQHYFKGIIPPPILFFSLLALGFIAQWLLPLPLFFVKLPLRLIVGLPVLTLAGALAFTALRLMKQQQTTVTFNKPTTRFLRHGPFRYTRNPLYLALTLLMVSVAVLANSAWHLVAAMLLLCLLNFGVVRREEAYLSRCFGDEYCQYKSEVRRWL